MLEPEELARIAEIKGLSLKNAEKDYLLELLLFMVSSEAGKKLVFKGGTALYKLYSLNRFSEDLDFTLASTKLDAESLFDKVIKRFRNIGIFGRIKEINDYRNQKNVRLELKGPLFNGNLKNLSLIVVNISSKEKPIYGPEQRKIFSQYTDIPAFDVFVMPLQELFAEKIRALLTRDKARDVYDVWFLLNKGARLILPDLRKKLKLYGISFTFKHLIAKIEEKGKMWESDLRPLIIGTLPEFKKVVNDMVSLLVK